MITIIRSSTADRIRIPAESPFTIKTSDRDMEKLHHEAAMEYKSTKGYGVMQIIQLEEIIIFKFETDLGEIEDTAGEFLNNLLEIYPGNHNCIHAKSNQICEDRKETAMLLWHK